MKKIILTLAAALVAVSSFAVVPHRFQKPAQVDGYYVMVGDMHMHTVFSDGKVWPTTRADEADYEGLDFFAITDHCDKRLQKQILNGLFNPDKVDRNTSWEIANAQAKKYGIFCIQGAELTRGGHEFPAHFNCEFIKDANRIADVAEAAVDSVKALGKDVKAQEEAAVWAGLREARAQGAFIQWNHPDWERQAPNETKSWPIHNKLYKAGLIDGVELVNRFTGYDAYAQQWGVEKNIALTAGTDCHVPMFQWVDYERGEWRPLTMVFAKDRSLDGIREALFAHRTAVYTDGHMYGPEELLVPLFKTIFEISDIKYSEKKVTFKVRNNSSIPLVFTKAPGSEKVVYPKLNYINSGEEVTYTIYGLNNSAPIGVDEFDMNIQVENFWSDVDTPITVSYHFVVPEKYRSK